MTRTERDRPAALAASEARQAAIKRENALRDAAPELLDALVMMLDAYEIPAVRDRARAAIAKATGDTP